MRVLPTGHRTHRADGGQLVSEYDAIQLALPGMPSKARPLTRAAQLQAFRDATDRALLDLARIEHPRAGWWWTVKVVKDRNLAHCYVCNDVFCSWEGVNGLTDRAHTAVMTHRGVHWRQIAAEVRS